MDGVWGKTGTFAYKGINIDSNWLWLLFKGFGRENSIRGFTFIFKQVSLRLYALGSSLGEENTCVAEEHSLAGYYLYQYADLSFHVYYSWPHNICHRFEDESYMQTLLQNRMPALVHPQILMHKSIIVLAQLYVSCSSELRTHYTVGLSNPKEKSGKLLVSS